MRASVPQTVHSLFSPSELFLEKQWLEIRDIFLGENFTNQDIARALELAAACPHKEAQWLTGIFAGKTVSTNRQARDIFLAEKEKNNSAASLCFAALLCLSGIDGEEHVTGREQNLALLRRSADLGCAFAQAEMASWTDGEEKFRFASLAAFQRERDGFCLLGFCFTHRIGCEKNADKGLENYLIAAELGSVYQMSVVGKLLDESDPLRWFWWNQAAKRGVSDDFVREFSEQVEEFESGSNNAAVVFQIGRGLNGNVDAENRTIFGSNFDDDEDDLGFDDLIGPANTAISFYKAQLAACRRAVDAWSLCCLRLNIYKDLRVLIGKMIWESRALALFEIDEDELRPALSPVQKRARK
jgi:hypothetical protein